MEPDAEGNLVFVYGTLRRGGSNAFRMDGAEFVSGATVAGCIHRIAWYPGLLPGVGCGRVKGDLFRVGGAHLAALDAFEGISANEVEGAEYRRVRAAVRTDAGEEMTAWVYEWIGPVAEGSRIDSGDWLTPPQ